MRTATSILSVHRPSVTFILFSVVEYYRWKNGPRHTWKYKKKHNKAAELRKLTAKEKKKKINKSKIFCLGKEEEKWRKELVTNRVNSSPRAIKEIKDFFKKLI